MKRLKNLVEHKSKFNYSIDVGNNFVYFMKKLQSNKQIFNEDDILSKNFAQSKELERLHRQIEALTKSKNELTEKVEEYEEKENQILKILKPRN